eukprot:5150121-Amphidinium_carterae.1
MKRGRSHADAFAEYAWETPLDVWDVEDQCAVGSVPIEEMTGKEAAGELSAFLMGNFLQGKLTAKQVCTISYYGMKAGLDDLNELAMHPSAQSGAFSKHLQLVVEREQKEVPKKYIVPVPAYVPYEAARAVHSLALLCPHEVLHDEMKVLDHMGLMKKFEADAPPCYWEHPVKVNNPTSLTVPFGLFLDGHQFNRHQSMTTIILTNLLTGRKHVLGCIRKKWTCGRQNGCECSGWCTHYPVFHFLQWSLKCLKEGVFPTQRHSHQLLDEHQCPLEDFRAALGGKPIGFVGLCLQMRGDLPEITSGFGLKSFSSKDTPCVLCHETKREGQWFQSLGDAKFARALRSATSYEEEGQKSSIVLDMNPELWGLVKNHLVQVAEVGRTMAIALPGYGLLPGDTLHPSEWQYDIWQDAMPEKCVFWRRRTAPPQILKHANPLLQHGLGCTLVEAYTPDIMHCWCLGIYQNYLHHLLWTLLEANVFGAGTCLENAAALSKDLQTFYKFAALHQPETHITRLSPNFSLGHTLGGARAKNIFRAKAHESLGLMRYAIYVLHRFKGLVELGEQFHACAVALLCMYTTLQEAPFCVPAATIEVW